MLGSGGQGPRAGGAGYRVFGTGQSRRARRPRRASRGAGVRDRVHDPLRRTGLVARLVRRAFRLCLCQCGRDPVRAGCGDRVRPPFFRVRLVRRRIRRRPHDGRLRGGFRGSHLPVRRQQGGVGAPCSSDRGGGGHGRMRAQAVQRRRNLEWSI